LATGYQAELIQAFCGDGSKLGVRIRYVKEPTALGTAGPLSLVRDHFRENEFFLLMNGDILTQLDFASFLAHAREQDCELLVGYTKHIYRSPFGVLSIVNGRITGIVEKPSQEFPVSAGIYCVKSTVLPFVPVNTFFTVPDLIHRLLATGKKVSAYHIQESWIGLESAEHFEDAVRELQSAPRSKGESSGS
jgi:NDP-sugar pyrophosphorylase family protein